MPGTEEVLAVILGGGRGTRLFPLTQQRSKPAVPIAGKYRLIDIPISNCINSGIFRIAVLTQFNSVSLHRHVTRTYQFDAFHTGWVQIWAAEQTMEHADWYQGTADAVRKQLLEIRSTRAKFVLVLAGDHLYRMDYEQMFRFHLEKDADITVAVQPVLKSDAARFGILKRDTDCQIHDFAEKPTAPDVLERMISRSDPEKPYLGSMGIYLFRTKVLLEMLDQTTHADFGGNVIPSAIPNYSVYGYDFDDYWEDIGTIRSFYETNLMLTDENPRFNFYDARKPIYTNPRYLPGSQVNNSTMKNVVLAEGCVITDAVITHSVIGLRAQIREGVQVHDSIIMGSDYYDREPEDDLRRMLPLGIGRNAYIEGAIVDKNARIGDGVVIKPFPRSTEISVENQYYVRDGVVVIPKNAVIQPGTYIGPEQS